ncbi:MAG TPA: hypothetical protein VK659_13825 [Asanoa sp.]|nr:hypothetical protein [Asanoa sp.]
MTVSVGSGAWVVGSAVAVGDAGVPVVVWALTTTPDGRVLVVVLLVVLLMVSVVVVEVSDSVVPGVVAGSGLDSGGAISGPAVPVDCTVPVDELSGDVDSSAQATPCPVAIAVPTPSATARRPTRPT